MRTLESQASGKEQTFLPENALVDFNSTESFTILLLRHQIRIIFLQKRAFEGEPSKGERIFTPVITERSGSK